MKNDHYSSFRQSLIESRLLNANKGIVGQFDPMNHYVKLCPDYFKILAFHSADKYPGYKECVAFSTYLHENIHWWQFCGSTSGFPLGLSNALQAHVNQNFLKNISIAGPLVKPISSYHKVSTKNSPDHNRIINNWYDIEFACAFLNTPRKADMIIKSPFFESIGHSLEILYANFLNTLVATIDRNNSFLPQYKSWEKEFDSLREKKTLNWTYDCGLKVPPFGFHSIIEGQARLIQIRYLYLASNSKLTWDDFAKLGKMGNDYFEAFHAFLKIINASFPSNPMDPVVSLFLLICDIAINPSEGYPCPISDYSRFIENISPGIRFIFASNVLQKLKELVNIPKDLNRKEYDYITSAICSSLNWHTPQEAAKNAYNAINKSPYIKNFYEDAKKDIFEITNFSVRLYYARHLDFMFSKSSKPEFFCWPERYMVHNPSKENSSGIEEARNLFEQHNCPFIWNPITERLEAHTNLASQPSKRVETLSTYFRWQANFDILRQWTVRNGDFSFRFCWVDKEKEENECKRWVNEDFVNNFGCKIDDITVL
jgi:hypothetical protein